MPSLDFFVNFRQFEMQKISTGHILDTFGAFWRLCGWPENIEMLNSKGSSQKALAVGDCSHQTKAVHRIIRLAKTSFRLYGVAYG